MSAPGARDTALRVLVSCRTARAWADAALSAQLRRDGLTGPEAALCSRIVYGVMQNRLLLDFYLGAYCSQKLDRLQPPLAEILRIGAYQILYLDKVPDSAAVNQAVEQAKANGRSKASGLVNAVLRQLSRNKGCLPAIPDREEAQALSIRYSHPKWLVKRLLSVLGPETEAFLAANNAPAPLTIQVNPLRTDAERLTAELAESGVTVRTHPWVPGCLELSHTGDLTALPVAGLELGRTPSPGRQILTVPDARTLVEATAERSPAAVPYLALGLFAGLRPSETCRLRACDVGAEIIRLEAAVTKTEQARTVEMRANLREILREFPLPPVGVLDPSGYRLRQELGRVAKSVAVGLPHDVLRHSFASYAYELTRDAASTAYEMGHQGTAIFVRHYRGLVPPGAGQRFFSIRPTKSQRPL